MGTSSADLVLHILWYCIAHASGEISPIKKPEKIKNIINKYASQELDESSQFRLSITQKFISMAINKMRELINDLEKAFINNDIVGLAYWP